jgi:signal transduction histidine kinase
MTFSKGIKPTLVEFDLAEFLPEAIGLSEEMAHEHGVEIAVRCEEPLRLKADPNLVRVVITNLVRNAIEAMAKVNPSSSRTIQVSAAARGSSIEVRVCDDGPGISPEIRQELFGLFVTGKPSGVGIGLAMSRRIARAHHGDLTLDESEPKTTFILSLPGHVS